MKKHALIGLLLLAAAAPEAGCVSTSTYEKMEADKNQEISALKRQNEDLAKQKADLEQEKSSVQQKVVTLEQNKASLERDKAALEQDKASLTASSQQTRKQYEALVQGLSKEVEKGQLQVRQYKNMLAVDLAEKIFSTPAGPRSSLKARRS